MGINGSDFVFCSFNAASKFDPLTFKARAPTESCKLQKQTLTFRFVDGARHSVHGQVWMHILHRVPSSVLWLMKYPGNPSASLWKAAASHGVDPARLIFFSLFPRDSHIRYKGLCHVMLDSPMYNGQRTMLDAAWADVLVVTKPLIRPYARIAASYMLPNNALRHLIARTDDEYEELAVALATKPRVYQTLRGELILTRDSLPAIQHLSFVHSQLASQLRSMWDVHVSIGSQYHLVRSSLLKCENY